MMMTYDGVVLCLCVFGPVMMGNRGGLERFLMHTLLSFAGSYFLRERPLVSDDDPKQLKDPPYTV